MVFMAVDPVTRRPPLCLLCTRGAYSVLSPSTQRCPMNAPRPPDAPCRCPSSSRVCSLSWRCWPSAPWPRRPPPASLAAARLDSPALQLVLCAGGRHVPDPAAGDRLQPLWQHSPRPDDARPEFSFTSWLAMLFAAGMGIGLMYFGVGEPMSHFVSRPRRRP